MQTSDLLRHQMIKSLMAKQTEKVADAAILIWEQMASEIISIVGEGGFNSLLARSIFLTQSSYPWLAASSSGSADKKFSLPDQPFAALKKSFEEQAPAQAGAANSLLLLNFTNILASLIGEQLTVSILRSAWSSNELLAGHPKEFKNE